MSFHLNFDETLLSIGCNTLFNWTVAPAKNERYFRWVNKKNKESVSIFSGFWKLRKWLALP